MGLNLGATRQEPPKTDKGREVKVGYRQHLAEAKAHPQANPYPEINIQGTGTGSQPLWVILGSSKYQTETAEGRAQGSPAVYLLLQLLDLLANLPNHWARLPHLSEQGCHLVTAQEPSGTAPQLMQKASLHCPWATENST